jgi:uncharacterized hydrophobic protein (TIGR00271 family)
MTLQKPANTLTPTEKQQVYQTIVEGSEPKLSFYILVILSTIIAAYGLIANSTAVVIGAMIVAPLMTPIIGIALSLVSGDSRLFRLAVIAEIVGVLCSVALGFMAGKFTFGVELSSEILARTQPLPYDILVALAAGLAGAYSLVNPKINAALAGVAIAVSLVPPLAVTGICLALERYDLALGAFLLFSANFLAIQLASVLIFISNGFIDYFHYQENEALINKHPPKIRLIIIFSKRFLPTIILLALVTWHLSLTLITLVNEKQLHRQLEAIVREEVKKRTGARLTEVNYRKDSDGKTNAIAVVMTPQEFVATDIQKIQQQIQANLNGNINLIIRSILSKDADSLGTIFLLDEEKLKRQQQYEQKSFLNSVTQLLKKSLENVLGAYLEEVRREDTDGIKTIVAIIRTPTAIRPNQVEVMESALQTLDKDIRLVVRSVLIRDADATRYLYESAEGSITDPLSEEELALHKKLAEVLKKSIKKIIKGGVLLDFQFTTVADTIEVLAVIQTPKNFSNKQVKLIQTQLKNEADNRVKLIVRSVVGTDMDENGFVIPEETPSLSAIENEATIDSPP